MNPRYMYLGILTASLMAALAVLPGIALQSAVAITDPNEKSAVLFAPGIVKELLKEDSARDLAPSAYTDPNEIGDPNAIGDPQIRAPGLLKAFDPKPEPPG